MMHPDESATPAELFKANGYSTAMIGKWHLGDNHPCRPEDQGFDHTVWHQGGGVDNAPDYWGNDPDTGVFRASFFTDIIILILFVILLGRARISR